MGLMLDEKMVLLNTLGIEMNRASVMTLAALQVMMSIALLCSC